jgi:hypothetical protein
MIHIWCRYGPWTRIGSAVVLGGQVEEWQRRRCKKPGCPAGQTRIRLLPARSDG